MGYSTRFKEILKTKKLVGRNKVIEDAFTGELIKRNIYQVSNGIRYAKINGKWRILGRAGVNYTVAGINNIIKVVDKRYK